MCAFLAMMEDDMVHNRKYRNLLSLQLRNDELILPISRRMAMATWLAAKPS